MTPKSRVETGSGPGSAFSVGAISEASLPSALASDAAGESINSGWTWANTAGPIVKPPSVSTKPSGSLLCRVMCRILGCLIRRRERYNRYIVQYYFWISSRSLAYGIAHSWDNQAFVSTDRVL